jgi:hypothetical protein
MSDASRLSQTPILGVPGLMQKLVLLMTVHPLSGPDLCTSVSELGLGHALLVLCATLCSGRVQRFLPVVTGGEQELLSQPVGLW